MILPTIKIKCDNELGYRIINLDEYDSLVDLTFDEVKYEDSHELQPMNIPTSKTRKVKSI